MTKLVLEKIVVTYKRYCEAYARCLTKAYPNSAGYDVYASERKMLRTGQRALVRVDLQMAIPKGYYGSICGRSGLANTRGVVAFSGVVYSDYRGIVCVRLFNFSDTCYKVEKDSRIAQMLIKKCNDV